MYNNTYEEQNPADFNLFVIRTHVSTRFTRAAHTSAEVRGGLALRISPEEARGATPPY